MDKNIDKLLDNKSNHFILVQGDNNYNDVLNLLKMRGGDSNWHIIFEQVWGEYYVAKVKDLHIRVIKEEIDIQTAPLQSFGDPFDPLPSLDHSCELNDVKKVLTENSSEAVLITANSQVLGIIGAEFLNAYLSQINILRKIYNWSVEKIRWIRKHPVYLVLAAILGAILTIFSLIGIYEEYFPETEVMTGEFNIAVAKFSTPNGSPSDIGEEVATVFSRRLETELDSYAGTDQLIRVFEVLAPSISGTITGSTPQIRADNALKFADTVKAHIVVYGTVNREGGDILISPEFVVATKYIENAEEILGQYRLGSPIKIEESIENLTSRLLFNQELTDRSSALSYITLGLFNYFTENYEKSLEYYNQADSFSAWEQSEGKEVLYVLMGNAAAKDYQFQEALGYYGKALESNEEYARGYIGLATILFRQAIEDSQDPDYTEVWNSMDYFVKALSAEDKPSSSFVDFKSHFGLGEAKLLLSQAGEKNLLNSAKEDFLSVVDFYQEDEEEILWDRAAQSYAHLGLIEYIQGSDMRVVESYYEKAVHVAAPFDRDLAGQYWEKVAELYELQNDMQSAIVAHEKAKKVVEGIGD